MRTVPQPRQFRRGGRVLKTSAPAQPLCTAALLDARGVAAVTAALAAAVVSANHTAPEQGNSPRRPLVVHASALWLSYLAPKRPLS
jgi:hypothetical protein